MIPAWQSGVIKDIIQATPNTRRFLIELPETTSFDFVPGQFITLDLPISEQRNKRWRSYSIASVPDGGNVIELVIVHVIGGLGTPYIFNNIKIGDKIALRGPQGVFTLPPVLDKDLFLICTGTGIAPFRSMLLYILNNNIAHKNIYLIFGSRRKENLLYPDEMKELEQKMPGFYYLPTLSRETWEGNNGYVHPVYEALLADKRPATFMLCGWRPMIDEAKERITNAGYDKKEIIVELYG